MFGEFLCRFKAIFKKYLKWAGLSGIFDWGYLLQSGPVLCYNLDTYSVYSTEVVMCAEI